MKLFPNLAGSLRFYFGLARILVLIFSIVWILILLCVPQFQGVFGNDPKLLVSVGEVVMKTAPTAVTLAADGAKPGALGLVNVRGSLQADLFSKDNALLAALRWTTIPPVLVNVICAWLLFSAFRTLCANIEKRDILTEANARLVRKSGFILITFGFASFLARLVSAQMMNGYLRNHATVSGLTMDPRFANRTGGIEFTYSTGFVSLEAAIVIGCMILLISEAFRQGLAFKAENDLTV